MTESHKHSDKAGTAAAHPIYRWKPYNEAQRFALPGVTERDNGKVAWQLVDNSIWFLVDYLNAGNEDGWKRLDSDPGLLDLPEAFVPVGVRDPQFLEVTLQQDPEDDTPPDYTFAVSARLELLLDGVLQTQWIPTLVGQTTTEAVANYVFAANGLDLPNPITLLVIPYIQLSNELTERRCRGFYLTALFAI